MIGLRFILWLLWRHAAPLMSLPFLTLSGSTWCGQPDCAEACVGRTSLMPPSTPASEQSGYHWILLMIALRFILWLLWRHAGLGASGGWELKHVLTGILWRHCWNSPPLYALSPEWLTSKLSTTAPVQSAGHNYSRRAQGVEKKVMAWRYTHTRVEPHSNMTRLEQCGGVSYGHDQASIAQWHGPLIWLTSDRFGWSQGLIGESSPQVFQHPDDQIGGGMNPLVRCPLTALSRWRKWVSLRCGHRRPPGGAWSTWARPPFEIPSSFWKRTSNNEGRYVISSRFFISDGRPLSLQRGRVNSGSKHGARWASLSSHVDEFWSMCCESEGHRARKKFDKERISRWRRLSCDDWRALVADEVMGERLLRDQCFSTDLPAVALR